MTQTPPPHKSKSNTIQLNQKKLQDFDQESKKYEQDLEKVNSLAKKTSDQLLKIQQQCSNEVSHKRTLERQLEMAVSEIRKAEEKHGKLRFGSWNRSIMANYSIDGIDRIDLIIFDRHMIQPFPPWDKQKIKLAQQTSILESQLSKLNT